MINYGFQRVETTQARRSGGLMIIFDHLAIFTVCLNLERTRVFAFRLHKKSGHIRCLESKPHAWG